MRPAVTPLFHLLTTAQHKLVRSKYDPPCYNVHDEVCVPNIENMCRSERDDFRQATFQQRGHRGRYVSNNTNTSECFLKAVS